MRHYFENHGNGNFRRRKAPYARYLVKKVKETGILIDKPKHEKPKTMCTPENIVAVAESVREAPSASVYRRPQQLNFSETSLRRIFNKDLGMTPYEEQLVQELKPIYHPMRFCFVKCSFPDEAHFDLGGYVNKQNFRIWDTENPHAYTKRVTL